MYHCLRYALICLSRSGYRVVIRSSFIIFSSVSALFAFLAILSGTSFVISLMFYSYELNNTAWFQLVMICLARQVKTKGYKKELEANKMLYRGFSNLPGGPFVSVVLTVKPPSFHGCDHMRCQMLLLLLLVLVRSATFLLRLLLDLAAFLK